jgi:Sec-independent protein translocase protein TatA
LESRVHAVIAILDNLGTTELLICAIVALLFFGKRLPEVASQAGATLAKFRRSLDNAVHDSGVEQEIRKIKSALPTDLSVRDVTRAAVRKFEDRVREEADAVNAALDPTKTTPSPTSTTNGANVPPSTEARPAPLTAPRAGIDPASQFASSNANGSIAPAPNESGKVGSNDAGPIVASESIGRNGADHGAVETGRSKAPNAASSEPDGSAVERAQQSGIPPRALPPGSVPRD